MDQIEQLRIYPPEKGSCKIIVVYEVPDQEELPQNGHELSIDLGSQPDDVFMILKMGRRLSWAGSTLHWKDISIKRS